MVRIKHKLTLQILLGLFSLMLFCAILINSNSVSAQASAGNSGLITTRNDFINALNKAENGDTILVGDIESVNEIVSRRNKTTISRASLCTN